MARRGDNNFISIDEAITLLNNNHCVAVPTETVYGLAAKISSPSGLLSIFQTKQRPFFDPLIVHVNHISQAQKITHNWCLIAETLAQSFWPGPLTLVLPKNPDLISDVISAGLNTVGIRYPNHSICQKIIESAGPLAAPSANRFGKTSPTQAFHVWSEFQGQVPIVNGGPCELGIESTIISITNPSALELLRPGKITAHQISEALEQKQIPFTWQKPKDSTLSPGFMRFHYMPSCPLVIDLVNTKADNLIEKIKTEFAQLPDQIDSIPIKKPMQITTVFKLKISAVPSLAARELYATLRAAPSSDILYLKWSLDQTTGEWAAIWDRLQKAATVILR